MDGCVLADQVIGGVLDIDMDIDMDIEGVHTMDSGQDTMQVEEQDILQQLGVRHPEVAMHIGTGPMV